MSLRIESWHTWPAPVYQPVTSAKNSRRPADELFARERALTDVERAVSDVERAVSDVERAVPDVERAVPDVERALTDVERAVPDVERANASGDHYGNALNGTIDRC